MSSSAYDIQEFYGTATGRFARRAILKQLEQQTSLFNENQDTSLRRLGLGFGFPYFDEGSKTLPDFAFLPPDMGLYAWAPQIQTQEKIRAGKNRCGVCRMTDLPLPDDSVSQIFMIHCLEFIDDPSMALNEIWRVLHPEGRLIMVVPHRGGFWASRDTTPFGQGRPYSLTQLKSHLRDENFVREKTVTALHSPPFKSRIMLNAFGWAEHLAQTVPVLPGVFIVEASKKIYNPITARKKRHPVLLGDKLRWIDGPTPQPG